MEKSAQTNQELRAEISLLRQQIRELEFSETQRKKAEQALREKTHDLNERIKEMHCLHCLSKLIDTSEDSIDALTQGVVELLPPAWQYPESACARITLDGHDYRTVNFRETPWRQQRSILLHGKPIGSVEIYYLEIKPEHQEEPFLPEERLLLEVVAERLGKTTERIRTLQALRESENRQRAILQSAMDGFWLADLSGQLLQVNETYSRMSGYSTQELLAMKVFDLEAIETAVATAGHIQKVIAKGEDRFETTHRRKDGSVFPVEISVQYRPAEGGRLVAFLRDISRRKHATEVLQASEARLKEAQRITHLGNWELDLLTNTVTWSDEIYRIFEIDPKTFGASYDAFLEAIHPEDREEVNRAYRRSLQTRQPYDIVHRLLMPDGRIKYAQEYCETYYTPEGQPTHSVGTVQDITERKQAEVALSQERERLSAIIRGTNAGTWEWNVQTGETIFNRRWAEIIGYTLEELSPVSIETWAKFAHPDDFRLSGQLLEQHFRGQLEYYEFESRMKHKRGDWIWVLDRGKVADWTADGKPIWIFGTHQEITDRKRVEESLRESEEKYRNIIEASPVPYALNDSQGNITFLNQAFIRTFGYTLQDIPTLADWWPKAYPDPNYRSWVSTAWQAQMEQAKQEGAFEPLELTLTCKDSSIRTAIVGAATLTESFEKTHLVIFYDITERKQEEAEKAKLKEQLQQAQRMESVGRLAGGVAHDFNNMLGVILGHADIALDQAPPAHPLFADLQEIRKAAERSSDLTRQLLAFARKQIVTPKMLDLNDITAGILKMLQRLIGEDIHLAWLPGVNLWSIRMDPSQIDQILANLCVNARDAITGVGRITLETKNVFLDQEYCANHADFVSGKYVLLAVSDNGCGMSKETLDKIFEPFFTTKGIGKGTGLGLSTVYGIVKQNNGFINVYSELGQGTTFRIYLPKYDAPAAQVGAEMAQESIPGGQETILLVEDEPALLGLNKLMMESLGYRVLAADAPGEAIRLATQYRKEIHLLITDVVMPEMNGRDLSQTLSTLDPQMKCLFISGYTANVIAHHGVLEEGVFFLEKPFSKKGLAFKIREVLDGK